MKCKQCSKCKKCKPLTEFYKNEKRYGGGFSSSCNGSNMGVNGFIWKFK